RRLVADAEQAALALGDDGELDQVAVECRIAPLELVQRRPARLAHGLARGLDPDGRLAHRLRPPRRWPERRPDCCCERRPLPRRGSAGLAGSAGCLPLAVPCFGLPLSLA